MNYKSMEMEMTTFINLIKRELDCSGRKTCFEAPVIPNAKFLVYLIHNQDRDVFQKDFEEAFSLRPSTISRSLRMLEEQGWIDRTVSPYDSRLKKITLTEKSLSLTDSFENALKNVFQKMMRDIPDDELESFFGTLSKMKANLEKDKK